MMSVQLARPEPPRPSRDGVAAPVSEASAHRRGSSDELGAPRHAGSESVSWVRVDIERYELTRGDLIVGYIDVVGGVFVALAGSRPDRAVEVAQTRDFSRAVEILTAPD